MFLGLLGIPSNLIFEFHNCTICSGASLMPNPHLRRSCQNRCVTLCAISTYTGSSQHLHQDPFPLCLLFCLCTLQKQTHTPLQHLLTPSTLFLTLQASVACIVMKVTMQIKEAIAGDPLCQSRIVKHFIFFPVIPKCWKPNDTH